MRAQSTRARVWEGGFPLPHKEALSIFTLKWRMWCIPEVKFLQICGPFFFLGGGGGSGFVWTPPPPPPIVYQVFAQHLGEQVRTWISSTYAHKWWGRPIVCGLHCHNGPLYRSCYTRQCCTDPAPSRAIGSMTIIQRAAAFHLIFEVQVLLKSNFITVYLYPKSIFWHVKGTQFRSPLHQQQRKIFIK